MRQKKTWIAFLVILGLIGCLSCSQSIITEDTFIYPAEFEKHESIWLAWPTFQYQPGYSNEDVVLKIIESLAPYVLVDLMVQDEVEMETVKQIFKTRAIPNDHVRFRLIPCEDIWIRDMGPIFLKNGKGEMKIVDFGLNYWGYGTQTSEENMRKERVDRLVARALQLPVIRTSIIGEGGNREFNGKGTMMVTEAVELQRNPDWTKAELERKYKRIFNIRKVIWLKKGLAEDDLTFKGVLPGGIFTPYATGGHIDEYARFVGPNTILLAEVTHEERDADPIARITYERMERNCTILKTATDQDGKPFEIIRVPHTKAIYITMDHDYAFFKELQNMKYEDGTVIEDDETIKMVLATSYLNFIVTNGVVLIPAYWKEGRSEDFKQKDETFRQIIKKVFPDRDIIQINPEAVNVGGGGMHCISQQMPATNEGNPIHQIKWTSKANLPLPHRNGKAIACGGKIYYMGGYCPETEAVRETSNYEYDPQYDKWTIKAKGPIGRSNFAMASYKDRIFAIGGDPLLPNNDCYFSDKDKWESLIPISIPRQHIDCGRIGNKIFVVGGLIRDPNPPADAEQKISAIATNTIEIYNIEENKWTRGNPSPEARHGAQVAVANEKLYVIGGAYDQTKEFMLSSAFERYDPESKLWKVLPEIPAPILAPGITVIKGKIFVIGGSTIENGSQIASEKVYIFDISKNKWGMASSLPAKIQFPGTAVIDDRIYVIGGCDTEFQAYNSVYEGIFTE